MIIRGREVDVRALLLGIVLVSAGAIAIGITSFIYGANFGSRCTMEAVEQVDAQRAEAQRNVKSWECAIVQSEAFRALENAQWAAFSGTLVSEQGKFRLVFQRNPNKEILTWHVTKMVTSRIIWDFRGPCHKQEDQPPLVKRLFEVEGVLEVNLQPHKVDVKISPAFEYERVRADIERAILARYGIRG